jgi:tRNA (guanine9-N1)-methyltransferase
MGNLSSSILPLQLLAGRGKHQPLLLGSPGTNAVAVKECGRGFSEHAGTEAVEVFRAETRDGAGAAGSAGNAGRGLMDGACLAENAAADGRDELVGAGLSKNARKRMAREVRMQERKRARRQARRDGVAERRAERRAARETALEHMGADEQRALLDARRDMFRAGREAERAQRARVRDALARATRYAVCIDLGWTDAMHDKELRSLVKQIAYSYSCLRKTAEAGGSPMCMSVAGLDPRVEELLTRQSSGWPDWPVELSRKPLLELHPGASLVYLTHDADDVLEELRDDRVYVIGGIVDRNRLKGATLDKARQLNVATARLNLDTSVHIEHGTPVLTVNHCVEILQLAASGMPWQDAYLKVLPPRKGLSTRAATNGNPDA